MNWKTQNTKKNIRIYFNERQRDFDDRKSFLKTGLKHTVFHSIQNKIILDNKDDVCCLSYVIESLMKEYQNPEEYY